MTFVERSRQSIETLVSGLSLCYGFCSCSPEGEEIDMRKMALIVGLIGLAAGSGSAAASVLVIGSDAGRECYEAASRGEGSLEALSTCDLALAGGLSKEEVVATHINRGVVKINGRRYEAAIEDFDMAIALDPSQPESYLNKGSALLHSGASLTDARSLFSEALQRETRRPELAYFGRAITSELAGDIRSAYSDYKRASDLAPRWQLPRKELSRFQVSRASSSMM